MNSIYIFSSLITTYHSLIDTTRNFTVTMPDTKSLFRQTLDEIPAETHIFIRKYTDILDRVQAILDRKGMKRRDLAEALGKSESEVSKWLAGEHNFTLKSIAKLEAVLGEDILVVAK